MRAVAQMISYEVILLLSSVTVVMMAGSLSLTKIVEAQKPILIWATALVYLHAVGFGRLCDVRHRGHGGDEPLTLRFAGR